MRAAGTAIHDYVERTKALFRVDLNSEVAARHWAAYLRHLDGIVSDSLLQTVTTSLAYLLDETDVKLNPRPLFTAQIGNTQIVLPNSRLFAMNIDCTLFGSQLQ